MLFYKSVICIFLITFSKFIGSFGEVSGADYAKMPELFYMDNYEKCMMLEENALYCTIEYEMEPLNGEKVPQIWKIIDKVNANSYNYRHHQLRHGICVPKTCPKILYKPNNITAVLQQDLTNCYNGKYKDMGLKGVVKIVECGNLKQKYPISKLDKLVALMFFIYIALVIFASLYEGIARYQSSKIYHRIITNSVFGIIIAAFSIPRNWHRLTKINKTEDSQRLKCIQGIRFYNMLLVIMAHSVLSVLMLPVANTRYPETIMDRYIYLLITSNSIVIATNFMIAAWLLTYNLLKILETKQNMNLDCFLFALVHRYLRLTPLLAVVIAFQSSWLVHIINNGPYSDSIVGSEYRNCRKNWWTNLLYINNYVDRENMCLQTTWYLALDTQYFIVCLFVIYLLKKYNNKVFLILATTLTVSISIAFVFNYKNGFSAIMAFKAEYWYMLRALKAKQFHDQIVSVYTNLSSAIMGIIFGYLYYTYRNVQVFTKKIHIYGWWMISFGFSLGIILIPGILIHIYKMEPGILLSSMHAALSKPIFLCGIGCLIFGIAHGIGWMAKWATEWYPTYFLGRISFSAYLIHVSVMKLMSGLTRSPVYVHDYDLFNRFLANVFLSFTLGTLLTLVFELPFTELQKFLLHRTKKQHNGTKKLQ